MYNIVLAADNNYIKYVAVVLSSIIKNTKENEKFASEKYIFHILTDGISFTNHQKLKILIDYLTSIYPCELKIHIIDEKQFQDFPKAWHVNHATYYRFEIANILGAEVSKCLYVDADILACDDIREVFYIDLNDKIVGVVTDSCSHLCTKLKSKKGGSDINFNPLYYFNAGIIMIDLNKWRQYNIKQKCIQAFLDYDHGGLADQSYLNIALKDYTYKLPLNWNLIAPEYILLQGYERHYVCKCLDESKEYNLAYTRDEFNDALNRKKIVHFCAAKPWWNLYYKNTRVEFNERKLWWDIALNLEGFQDDFRYLKLNLELEFIDKKLNSINNNKATHALNVIQVDYTAVSRVKNQLSYKIGQVALISSKNILDFICIPVYIFSIIISHRQDKKIYHNALQKNPKLKFLPLEQYPDYDEAIKLKQHFSYKLGSIIIHSLKYWYLGGILVLPFRIFKLYKNHKKRHNQ
ncbi:glycosyltransferase family 8 protein [Campylobacter jejuni]|uniref:glycosyltransferase family 8 protein n=2 Tax=Campylobacter TaxID=194 RepID=UPI0012727E43|nr:glycosyltransferase family 8 protein [Campylobacter lari]EAI4303766.1 glycosyltransferase family 8 protein [Campylobacter lari]EAK0795846.1 glycosyltransferase family 8 protein [Campylobacter lari]EAK0817389.1 glycosyltransferase family 8 protein [Campylobacter lari]EAK9942213.1 glycosyltransferase family 8 protein [Campylobacter lari]EDA0674568.1 glycosyltransferase family 8 protein [Campylobacter lari]